MVNKKTVPYIVGCCCLLLRPSYATDSDEGLASFVVADNGSIAATLVFSLYELWFTNNPFYAAMVTLSVIFRAKRYGYYRYQKSLEIVFYTAASSG